MPSVAREGKLQVDGVPVGAAGVAFAENDDDRLLDVASAIEVIVEAVPIVLQVPVVRTPRPSSSTQSAGVMVPARSSSQYFFVCVPAPTLRPRHQPFDIGPAGQKMAGRPMLIAPISRPGVDLSQPPSSTAPSTGCERSSSSVSIARKLR